MPKQTNGRDTTSEEEKLYSFAINHRDRNSSDKILSLIKQDPQVLGNIVNHEKSRDLLSLAVNAIVNANGLPAGVDLSDVTENQLSNIVSLFSERGKLVSTPTASTDLDADPYTVEWSGNITEEQWVGLNVLDKVSDENAESWANDQGWTENNVELFVHAHNQSKDATDTEKKDWEDNFVGGETTAEKPWGEGIEDTRTEVTPPGQEKDEGQEVETEETGGSDDEVPGISDERKRDIVLGNITL